MTAESVESMTWTKNIEAKYLWIEQDIAKGRVEFCSIGTDKQVADIFTTFLERKHF